MDSSNKIIKQERINNSNGTYTVKEVYKEPDFANGLSCIKIFDNKDKELHCERYKNKNFTGLLYKHDCKNYTETTCNIYAVYTELQDNNWYSAIAKTDYINNKNLSVKYFKENNFLSLCGQIDYIDIDDNSYMTKSSFTVPYKGWLSRIEYYNNDDKYLKGLFYKDMNFQELGLTEIAQYNQDDSSIRYAKLEYPNEHGHLSYIENFDEKYRCIGGQYYANNDYTDLVSTTKYKYKSNGSYEKIFIHEFPNENNELSQIDTYDKNNRMLTMRTFWDKDFKQIRISSKTKHNKDGSYVDTMKLNFNKFCSEYSISESYYDIHGKKIKEYSKLYERNKLQGKYVNSLNEDGTYTCKIISNNSDMPSCINIYDNNGNMLSSKAYKDANFKTLIAVKKLEYLNNGGYREYISYAMPTCNGCLSEIEEYDSEGNFQTGKYFKDSNYKEIISEE